MVIVIRILLSPFLIICFAAIALGNTNQISPSSIKVNDFNPFNENGKVGLKSSKGEILIPAQYEALGWSNGKFSVVENVTGYQLNGNWGLINVDNNKITKPDFTDLSPGLGSVIVARKKINNSVLIQAGCLNTSGKVIIPFSYDGLSISSTRAIAYVKKGIQFKHGLIDFTNNVLIPLKYQNIYPLGSLRYAVVSFENKTAIFSDDGKQLTNFLIDSISSFKKNYAIIYQNQRQGLMNRSGDIVLEPVYREIRINDEGGVMTRKPDAWLFLEGENKMSRQYNADSIQPAMRDLYVIKTAGTVQLVDRQFKPLNNILFSSIGDFKSGKALFVNSGKMGVLRKNGSVAIEPKFDFIIPEQNYIRASDQIGSNKRWNLLDSIGKPVTSRNYEYIGAFNSKFFPVKNKGFWGAVDRQGKEIIACVHDSLVQYQNEYVVVKFKGQYGIINTNEDWIITPQFHKLKLLNNDLYIEIAKPNQFLKSLKGDLIYFTQNPVEIKDNYFLESLPSGTILKIGMNGVIADRYFQTEGIEKIFVEQEGFRAIKKDGKFGFIDERSRLRVANRYENVKDFSEGLAAAKILGKWGFINKSDRIAVQPVYDEVFSFQFGYAIVKQKNLYGLIDNNGKVVLPVRYDGITILNSKRFKIELGGLLGLADSNGKIIVNAKYNAIKDLDNGYIIVEREDKWGVITIQGISTIPLIYDGMIYDAYHNQFLALKKSDWEEVKL